MLKEPLHDPVSTLRDLWGVCVSLCGIRGAIICEQVRGPWGHSLCFISMQWGGHFAFRAWMPPWDGLSLISAGGVWCRIKTPYILSSATSSRSSLDFPLSHYLFILIVPTIAAFKSLMTPRLRSVWEFFFLGCGGCWGWVRNTTLKSYVVYFVKHNKTIKGSMMR